MSACTVIIRYLVTHKTHKEDFDFDQTGRMVCACRTGDLCCFCRSPVRLSFLLYREFQEIGSFKFRRNNKTFVIIYNF